MEYGFNKTLSEQEKLFEKILRNNKKLWNVLEALEEYALKNKSFKNYYLGAGALNETVFNYYHNFDDNYGIKDYDIVYFDEDTSYEKEDIIIKELSSLLKNIDVCLDIKNQARVHLWCKGKSEAFSVEEAISRWSTTVTCIGVRVENNTLKIFAPYGLNDLFGMIIRPVKFEFTEEKYNEKVKKLKEKWPMLDIRKW